MLNVRMLMPCAGLSFSLIVAIAGCEKQAPIPAKPPAADQAHDPILTPDDGHDHSASTPPAPAGHHHGPTTQLGEQSVSGFTIKASRDGDITPGGDAAIDVWVTGGQPVRVVRFWIGREDASGSVKARAPFEGGHAHTHAEIPSPLPPGSMLWVEIETGVGEKIVTSFNLHME